MNKVILSALFLVSAISSANPIQGVRGASAVRVTSVHATNVGEGHPVTEVTVEATFSNRCLVPLPNELVSIINYSKNYDELVIALGKISNRVCTMEYMPVMVNIVVGRFTKPNDGNFSRITVNQVEAD